MIGFEIEISLPVTDGNGKSIPGDTPLARSRTVHGYGRGDSPVFTLVSDHRELPSKALYSNLEFVTMPWYVVGDALNTGPTLVQNTLQLIRQVRDRLYAAGEAPLGTAGDRLTCTAAGSTALLAPENGYVEQAGTADGGNGLFLHYSVGVPLGGLPGFLDRLRAAAPVEDGAMLADARHRLVQAKAFAAAVLGDFKQKTATSTQARVRRELDGYLQLAYTQIVAFADYVARPADAGQIKNGTVVLSRAALSDVFAQLDPGAQTFLRQNPQKLVTLLAAYQEKARSGRTLQFQDRSVRAVVANAPVQLEAYAVAAFDGRERFAQERVFGGMREIDPHTEEEAVMIPFEIRTMGARWKTWDGVANDLTSLCAWAQTAYEAGRP